LPPFPFPLPCLSESACWRIFQSCSMLPVCPFPCISSSYLFLSRSLPLSPSSSPPLLRTRLLENLSKLQHAPSVPFHTRAPDTQLPDEEEEEPDTRHEDREADGDAPSVLEGPAAASVKEEVKSGGGKGTAAGAGTGGAGGAAGGAGGGGAVTGEGKKRPLPEASG
ncbi:unnamed protein product, partial [Closterium sp. NIES-54]